MSKINKNLSLTKPFLLKPAGRDSLWGGSTLKNDFNKEIDMTPLAETWECSTHPNGLSTIASGKFYGATLKSFIKKHPEILGTNVKSRDGSIPILVKFIDAKEQLSVQVHPTDEYAKEHERGQKGKTEMWYVVGATKDATLTYGFKRNVSEETVRKGLETGSIERYMNKVQVHKNDVFLVEAGTIHAIGAGCLIIEVQESSDLTYRLYDFNRVDKNGNKRKLDIEKGLQVLNRKAINPPKQPIRVLRYTNGMASESIISCPFFQVDRLLVNTQESRKMATFQSNVNSFEVLTCYYGCGSITYGRNNTTFNFFKGDTIFVPANSIPIKIHGRASFIKVHC